MSITVSFTTSSKRENSTKQLTMDIIHNCNFKNGCSMLNPTLLLELNTSTFPQYTAFKIENRYYKVTDIKSVRNNLFEISGTIDVLATYKSAILASTQFVSYSSHKTSDWLADTRIPLSEETQLSVQTALTGILSTIGTYVLTVVGENGCCTYYTQNEALLSALLAAISTWETNGISDAISRISQFTPNYERANYRVVPSGDSLTDCMQVLIDVLIDAFEQLGHTMANVQDAANTLISSIEAAAVETGFVGNAYANAPQCIRSCIWVPFDYALAPSGTGQSPIKLGTFNTGVNMPATSGKAVDGSVNITIPWHYSDWRRAVCEDVYLYLPLVGMVQLSGDSLTNVSTLTVDWSVTYTDGVICYKVRAGNSVIGSFGGQCAANYPLGIAQQASAGELVNAVIQGADKMVSGLIQSTLSPTSVGGVIGGLALNAAVTGYNVENIKKSTHISCIGGVGGGAGIGLGRDIVCYTVNHPTIIAPNDMEQTMGLPTMQPMSLATLTGYCQCANAHVDAPATETELGLLDTYLNSGFFIE